MQLHASLVAFVDGEGQRVPARIAPLFAREASVPGLYARRIDYGAAHAGLQKHGVDAVLLQLVEDAAEGFFLFLDDARSGAARLGPVEAPEGGQPHAAQLVFRCLGTERKCRLDALRTGAKRKNA